ncbi:sugar O-acyltransferase, sialic acid O-acetyltransferase NeuD family [Pseudarcicella hirudinis]|uniref:Sugar O-acyltransferase, sialic acid O-acetyltransferase NeuD family n=1 Tax=Pseudarcicella hirudinis TaxID=1079859 RepID=A0A1I5Y513_9BACT|nr:acetyltransferase [Pseudarcicella hirudinis]SFQ39288.1 sugar O-acyltransferase, sialic acid O-acetyltransferase NeuD family [Pseudarcicella hirudinis]
MAKVVVFGTALVGELAHFYLTTDSPHEIVAFTVEREYLKEETFKGLPVVPFEDVVSLYPPSEYKFFAPLSERKMNQIRARVYADAKEKGYEFISYISSKATVLTDKIGENCFILEDNTIQPFVEIGNNVVLWSGNHIGHHGVIKDHVYFTSHVVLSGRCIVEPYCFFGVNATIRDGVHLGEGTLIAMGANLTAKKTEDWSIWKGNPAQKANVSSKDINL